jgi:hypothetical protein
MSQPASRKRVEDSFYKEYGKALAAWARIEYVLSLWFAWACDPDNKAQRQIRMVFHSARSFNGSADMLKAAFYANVRDEELVQFFRTAMNRTMGYYAFRNRLAHDLPTYSEPASIVVIQGQDDFFQERAIITKDDLKRSTKNFERLYEVWISTCPFVRPKPALTPKEGLRYIEQLPAEAPCNALSQKQRGRQRQLRARRGSRG